jgi:hypothetical protein
VILTGSLNINTSTGYPIYVSGSRSYLSLDTNATRLGTDQLAGELLLVSTYDTGSSQAQFVNTAGNSVAVGVLGKNVIPNQAPFGNARDGFLFASATTPVLHIINAATGISGSEDRHNDSIKLWAGINPSNLTSSMLIIGTGSTKGNVSIGGVDPQNKLEVVGSVLATSFTGSLLGTSSYATTALTASNALTSSYVNTLTQNVIITGSLDVSGSITATSYAGNGINNGKLLAMTELTASTLATFTVPSSTVFAAINCNSDATNRYAKVTFTAPSSGIVEIIFEADIVFVNSAAVQMIGLSTGSASTTTPSNGWFRINGDADASSATYRAVFNINALTPGTVYSYYVMAVCDFSGNLVRCGSRQTGAYVAGADRPSPLRVYARDMGTTVITTNPSS